MMRSLVIGLTVSGMAALAVQATVRADVKDVSEARVLDYGSSGPWKIALVHDGSFYRRCGARRQLPDGSGVYVAMRAGHPDKAFVVLNGPKFGERFVATSRGLGQVDNGPMVVLSAERGREENEIITTVDLGSEFAAQIKKGSTLTIVLAGYKYAIPLTGTGKMMEALISCAANGQAAVDAWAFENAVSATLGE
jgi:hypothetical protein